MKEAIQHKLWEFKETAKKIWDENALAIVTLGPAAIGLLAKTIQIVGRHGRICKEQAIKDKTVWDPVVGHYWRLKRKLSKDEWLYITKRRKHGEMLGDILESLHVLK